MYCLINLFLYLTGITINGANIASDPIMRRMFSETGGVVHFLDRVLLP